jgi:hypothetical protein
MHMLPRQEVGTVPSPGGVSVAAPATLSDIIGTVGAALVIAVVPAAAVSPAKSSAGTVTPTTLSVPSKACGGCPCCTITGWKDCALSELCSVITLLAWLATEGVRFTLNDNGWYKSSRGLPENDWLAMPWETPSTPPTPPAAGMGRKAVGPGHVTGQGCMLGPETSAVPAIWGVAATAAGAIGTMCIMLAGACIWPGYCAEDCCPGTADKSWKEVLKLHGGTGWAGLDESMDVCP